MLLNDILPIVFRDYLFDLMLVILRELERLIPGLVAVSTLFLEGTPWLLLFDLLLI